MVTDFSRPGAVDLSSLGAAPPPAASSAAGGLVLDVTEQTFQTEVLDRSMTVPVVIDFWAEWCGPCKQLSPVLEKLAAEYGGRFVLAKIDTEANQQLAAAAQIQSIPMVIAVVGGKVLPLFNGALPEAQVRQYLDKLLEIAQQEGVSGIAGAAEDETAGPPADTRMDDAFAAVERGDLDTAADAYRSILADRPADPDAKAGLAQVGLLARTTRQDAGVVGRADAAPADADLACDAADLEVATGEVEEAFNRLIRAVQLTSGPDRDRAKTHLLELFDVVGPDDPRVASARTALANALF